MDLEKNDSKQLELFSGQDFDSNDLSRLVDMTFSFDFSSQFDDRPYPLNDHHKLGKDTSDLDDYLKSSYEQGQNSAHTKDIDDESELLGPGLLYKVEDRLSTFVIRIKACECVGVAKKLVEKNPEQFPSLRLNDISELKFFTVDQFALAKEIEIMLSHRVFSKFEEHIMNVSDPSDSWWLEKNNQEFKLYFKLSHTHNLDALIKLGPIGDAHFYEDTFQKIAGYFQLLFGLKEFEVSHSGVLIIPEDPNSLCFKEFYQIFEQGLIGHNLIGLWNFLEAEHFRSEKKRESLQKANYLFTTIAVKRNFWLKVEESLNCDSQMIPFVN